MAETPNPRGWRRLWPGKLWLQTIQPSPGVWEWKIWSEDKTVVLALGVNGFTRQADCVRGALQFFQTMPEPAAQPLPPAAQP